jgi:hypothetical protein
MHRRIAKLFLLVAALGLLAFGAASLASGGSKPAPLKSNAALQAKGAADGDKIQQGDQSAPDTAAAAAEEVGAEAPSSESAAVDGDQAAQDAACAAAGIASDGPNVEYDGTTCTNNG